MPSAAIKWDAIENVPQEAIDHAASVIVSAMNSGKTILLTQEEANAILCAVAPYSTTASNALDRE